jgi:hypothetical protein
LKREAETQRASSRAKRFSVADRARALQRAGEIGTAAAAVEFGVSASTLRTWRRRLPSATQTAVEAPAEPGGELEQPAPDGPLDVVASAEVRARDAGAAAEEILAQLRAASARGDANGARAFGAAYAASSDRAARASTQVLDLRAQHAVVVQREADLLIAAVEGAIGVLVAQHGLPGGLTGEARRLVGEEVRRVNAASMAGERVEAVPVRPRVSAPVAEVVAPAAASVPDEDVGDDPGIDDESVNDVVIDLDADEDELAEDELDGDGAEPSAEDAEIPEHELVALGEIPMAFRNRFAIGDEGQHRSRVAWTRRVRAEKAQRAAAEEAAEEADERVAAEAAAARAARRADPGPAPSGWGSRGGRGRGPTDRAGG